MITVGQTLIWHSMSGTKIASVLRITSSTGQLMSEHEQGSPVC